MLLLVQNVLVSVPLICLGVIKGKLFEGELWSSSMKIVQDVENLNHGIQKNVTIFRLILAGGARVTNYTAGICCESRRGFRFPPSAFKTLSAGVEIIMLL